MVRYFQQPREFKTNETQALILTKPSRRFWPNLTAWSFIVFASSRQRKLHRFCIVMATILTKPKRRKLHRFCIVTAVKASSFLHRRGGETRPIMHFASPEAFAGWVWLESTPEFHSLLLSSSFWTLWVARNISPLRY